MIGTFDYQERMKECAEWAEKAANDQAKVLWKEMERFWRQRAIVALSRPDWPLDSRRRLQGPPKPAAKGFSVGATPYPPA
jgi:hypothetical protein